MSSVPVMPPSGEADSFAADTDVDNLHRMGYGQELLRRMNGFSNYAIALSTICILAGCITSFHLAFCGLGGGAIGIGWLVGCGLSLCFALTMGQVASAFPIAGGLYHWGSILGGKGWGWATAWFNMVGLITVLAAINVGTYLFALGAFAPLLGIDPKTFSTATALLLQLGIVGAITFSQAMFNHLGIRTTTRLTDFSGYLIVVAALILTVALLVCSPTHDVTRLFTFTNFSGAAGNNVWPETANVGWIFALGLLLPAYTVTGFDSAANTSEETVNAAMAVPKSIVSAVIVSALAGYVMIAAAVMAIPDLALAAAQGDRVFAWIMGQVLPGWLAVSLFVAITVAQYLCGLATLTSASRMVFAFARDGGLPASAALKHVSVLHRTPATAIWTVAILSVVFTIYTPVYSTITAVSVIFIYISYMLPTALGLRGYGRTWTEMGPWSIGAWYRPLAVVCLVGGSGLVAVGVAPPNDKAIMVLIGFCVLLAMAWFGGIRSRFAGPHEAEGGGDHLEEIAVLERAVGQPATARLKIDTSKLGNHP